LLFGQYRRGDANDPDVYVASVAAILADYPADTIRYVTDPRTGIAGNPINPNWTGPPDIADVKRACERHYGPMRRAINTKAAINRQFAEREKMAIGDRSKRPTYEELVRRCNEAGLIIGQPKHRIPPVRPADIMAKYGISQEEWNKIPNGSHCGAADPISSVLLVRPACTNSSEPSAHDAANTAECKDEQCPGSVSIIDSK
jgi:hypothetical protein